MSGNKETVNKETVNKEIVEEKRKREEKRRDDSKTEALVRFERDKLEKKEKEKIEKDKIIKKRNNKNNNNKTYNIKILYKIPKISGEKEYEYVGEKSKNNLQLILINDKVQYFNENHPNHLKRGIVRKFKYNSNNISPAVNFEIIFNDPPFLYEKNNKTGQMYKTTKKIKVIEQVSFKNLKKIESGTNKITIEVSKFNYETKNFNLRDAFEKAIYNKKNMIVKFYQIIIFLMNFDFNNKDINNKDINNKDIADVEKIINDSIDKSTLTKKFIFEQLKYIYEDKFKDQIMMSDIFNFNLLFKKNKEEFLEILENQTDKNKEIKLNSFELFDKIIKSFGRTPGKKDVYNLSRKDFFINNDLDVYRFIKGVFKKKSEINKSTFISYEKKFENEIRQKISETFIKYDTFYPQEVKIKYTNNTTLDKKEFYNNPNKLVKPTDDKVFTINKYDFIKITQPNDFTKETNETKETKEKIFIIDRMATDENPGIIKIKLNIDLDMKDLLTTDELINESKGDTTLRMIGDFFGNIGNKLNCDESRRNLYKNMDDIKKKFKKTIIPPQLPNKDTGVPTEEQITRKTSIQKITPSLSIITNIKGGNKSLKKNIKSSRNRTMKNR